MQVFWWGNSFRCDLLRLSHMYRFSLHWNRSAVAVVLSILWHRLNPVSFCAFFFFFFLLVAREIGNLSLCLCLCFCLQFCWRFFCFFFSSFVEWNIYHMPCLREKKPAVGSSWIIFFQIHSGRRAAAITWIWSGMRSDGMMIMMWRRRRQEARERWKSWELEEEIRHSSSRRSGRLNPRWRESKSFWPRYKEWTMRARCCTRRRRCQLSEIEWMLILLKSPRLRGLSKQSLKTWTEQTLPIGACPAVSQAPRLTAPGHPSPALCGRNSRIWWETFSSCVKEWWVTTGRLLSAGQSVQLHNFPCNGFFHQGIA